MLLKYDVKVECKPSSINSNLFGFSHKPVNNKLYTHEVKSIHFGVITTLS